MSDQRFYPLAIKCMVSAIACGTFAQAVKEYSDPATTQIKIHTRPAILFFQICDVHGGPSTSTLPISCDGFSELFPKKFFPAYLMHMLSFFQYTKTQYLSKGGDAES